MTGQWVLALGPLLWSMCWQALQRLAFSPLPAQFRGGRLSVLRCETRARRKKGREGLSSEERRKEEKQRTKKLGRRNLCIRL